MLLTVSLANKGLHLQRCRGAIGKKGALAMADRISVMAACERRSPSTPPATGYHPLRPLPDIPQGIAPDATTRGTHSGAAREKIGETQKFVSKCERGERRIDLIANILPGLWFEPETVRFGFGKGDSERLIVTPISGQSCGEADLIQGRRVSV
jgi:hypothetical protein